MAKIPLRAYIKDIENLIERGEIDQAIAHAKNILKTYPKHIETYRLLGKAYLESQRYSEATDILQRVLSVVPDDFVSQIGISIIREDEGNMDAAIWHMERAYEVQPFNPAVQDELRRLYGRRDGIEPPKIRLTRGALIRMYARGELYPQAIGETRAALAEDPQRLDLLVLLARLYFLNGQKVEATEVCSSLIGKLPYCYEANLILNDVLPGTSRAEDAHTFQQRLYALDPYATYLSPNAPTADLVPDQAVMVEQFLFESALDQQDQRPEWARNVGVEWQETEDEHLPDWLNTLAPHEQAAPAQTGVIPPAQPEQPAADPLNADQDAVPDWMKSAGWAKTDRSADEIMKEQLQFAEDDLADADDAAPAEIPDWLQTMAPPLDADEQAREADRLNLLDTILPGQPQGEGADQQDDAILPGGEDDSLDWLGGAADTGAAAGAGAASLDDLFAEEPNAADSQPAAMNLPDADVPDWLSGASTQQPATPAEGDLPDWLNSLGDDETIVQAPGEAAAAPVESTTDWLSSIGSDEALLDSTTPTDTGADWLAQMGAAEPADEAPTGQPDAAVPDWMQSMAQADQVGGDQAEANEISADLFGTEQVGAGFEAVEDDAEEGGLSPSTSWMASFEDERSADELPADELQTNGLQTDAQLTSPEEALPDWMKGADMDTIIPAPRMPEDDLPAAAPAETQPPVSQPVAQEPGTLGAEAAPAAEAGAMPDFSDMDAAMAWLESLAAKQGADEATLVTRPEDRLDAPPDWVQQETAAAEAGILPELADELPAADADLPTIESPHSTSDMPGAEISPVTDELTADSDLPAAEADLPDWMQTVGIETETAEGQAAPTEQPEEQAAWLSSLAETTQDETAAIDENRGILEVEPALETPAIETDLPDWLKAAQDEAEDLGPAVDEQSLPSMAAAPDLDELTTVGEPPLTQEPPLAQQPPSALETPAEAGEAGAMPDFSDMDSAMAWLESLAAKHGADEATLVTRPEDRLDAPPDWVQQQAETQEEDTQEDTQPVRVTPAAESEPAAVEPVSEQPESTFEAQADVEETNVPDWMQPDTETPAQEADLPDWLADEILLDSAGEQLEPAGEPADLIDLPAVESDTPAEILAGEPDGEPAAEAGAMPDFSDMDAAMAWLESLAAKQGADEATLVTRPEDRLETPPEWVTQEAEQGEQAALAADLPSQPEAESETAMWSESLAETAAEPDVIEPLTVDSLPESETPAAAEPAASEPTTGELTAGVPTDKMDLDASFSWLESLAAGQGAQEGSLITEPEDRQAEMPEWIQNLPSEDSSTVGEGIEDPPQAAAGERQPGEDSGWQAQEYGAVESGLPAQSPDWSESVQEEEPLIDQTAPRHVDESPAEWLPEMPETPLSTGEPASEGEGLPSWLQQVEAEENSAAMAESAPKASLEDWLQSLESESTAPPAAFVDDVQPEITPEAWQAEETEAPAIDPSLTGQAALSAAQAALNRGRLEPALEAYNRFIENGEFLDEVIHDLRDALYRYPVDISVWQALGDAFAHNNQLQEALDAYTKAEELLR